MNNPRLIAGRLPLWYRLIERLLNSLKDGNLSDYEIGYGKPPIAHQFKPGEVNNPGGMSKETKAKIDEARDKAADVYLSLVTALSEVLTEEDKGKVLEAIRGDNLKLLKDVMDRSVGTPKQTVETDLTTRTAPKGLDAFYAPQEGTSQRDDDD